MGWNDLICLVARVCCQIFVWVHMHSLTHTHTHTHTHACILTLIRSRTHTQPWDSLDCLKTYFLESVIKSVGLVGFFRDFTWFQSLYVVVFYFFAVWYMKTFGCINMVLKAILAISLFLCSHSVRSFTGCGKWNSQKLQLARNPSYFPTWCLN